ncbi:MAG: CHAD domain-containing protein [Myxococcales bacterium]|nr:CHAD domain-containing protein [Myxococcales bacterium]
MARAWPVPGIAAETPVDVAAPRILAVRLDEVAHHRERALLRTDPEDLHDLRVATRRLRAALRLLGGPLAQAEPGVKALGDALGWVRDIDVQVAWLERVRAVADRDERPGIAWLLDERRALLPPLEAAARAAADRYHQHLEPPLRIYLREGGYPEPLGGSRVRRAVARRLRRVGRRAVALLTTDDVAGVHALRIAGKKARYDLELVESALGAPATDALARLKQLQELTGEVHDRDVHLALLPEWIARAPRPEQPGAVRLLRDALAERRHSAALLDGELVLWRTREEAAALAHAIAAG